MATAQTVELSDGRLIGFDDRGAPDGPPVLFFHGTPGSRLYWDLVDAGGFSQTASPARVIAVDRPGMGWSTLEPQRSVGSFAFDIAQLVDRLELDRFGAFGFCGGAPYALAVAAFMPERVSAVGLISPMGDLSVPSLLEAIDPQLRRGLAVATETPTARAAVIANMLGGDRMVHTVAEYLWSRLPLADRALLGRPSVKRTMEHMLAEAARQGIEGPRLDIDLMARAWDFPVGDIEAPVRILAGGKDPWAPPAMAEWLLGRLSRAELERLPDDGHFTVLARRGAEMLTWIGERSDAERQPLLGHRDHEATTSSASAR